MQQKEKKFFNYVEAEEFTYAEVDSLGSYREDLTYNKKHIESVLALKLVDVEAIL